MNDGGPAFPTALSDEQTHDDSYGMSLRDWFAGMALVGNIHLQAHLAAQRIVDGMYDPGDQTPRCDKVARNCYVFADAMLAERAKETP